MEASCQPGKEAARATREISAKAAGRGFWKGRRWWGGSRAFISVAVACGGGRAPLGGEAIESGVGVRAHPCDGERRARIARQNLVHGLWTPTLLS
jgi:hypothetical protein